MTKAQMHHVEKNYLGRNLDRIAYPIGGLGSGMFCLEGSGAISHWSIEHHPDVFNEVPIFAALYIQGYNAKLLEGPVPGWKKFGQHDNARGGQGSDYGLARMSSAVFRSNFPFADIRLKGGLPISVSLTGWSPFIPGDADNSGLPCGAIEYHLVNHTAQKQDGVFSCNAKNMFSGIQSISGGFVCKDPGASLAIFTDEEKTIVDYCWYRGDWFDPLSMAWKKVSEGKANAVAPVKGEAPGASLFVPFKLRPGEQKTIRVYFCWYVPNSRLRVGEPSYKSSDTTVVSREHDQPANTYMPWYASKFKSIEEVAAYWQSHYDELKCKTKLFTDAFYNSTLPPEIIEAMAANLSIMKSPTVLRQYDGRFWGWEGSNDAIGSCFGTCTHVYNYAQALCHLFPALQRSISETELGEGLDANGHQTYRQALPIRPQNHADFAAADGQLGGIMRVYREWRISGNKEWLKQLYPKVKRSLDYCIRTWDPDHNGLLTEPHHNTYDIEFWGADGMCTSIYLGALEAFCKMSDQLHENHALYTNLLVSGRKAMSSQLFNGEYFNQKIQWIGLHQSPKVSSLTPEAKVLFEREGPQYQYGNGCLSDGVIGSWMARVCGLEDPLNEKQVSSHLSSVYRYNFKTDLSNYSNPQRPTFALGKEGGLLLCSWPKGGALSLPFVYSNEVWTGIEYQVASHLIFEGKVKEGLQIVRTARQRYDGTVRSPFDEYECGHWYMRAMASYALLEALTGVRYDAVDKTLYVHSQVGDFTSFLSTDTGFGNVTYKKGKATLKVAYGCIDVEHIKVSGS